MAGVDLAGKDRCGLRTLWGVKVKVIPSKRNEQSRNTKAQNLLHPEEEALPMASSPPPPEMIRTSDGHQSKEQDEPMGFFIYDNQVK